MPAGVPMDFVEVDVAPSFDMAELLDAVKSVVVDVVGPSFGQTASYVESVLGQLVGRLSAIRDEIKDVENRTR